MDIENNLVLITKKSMDDYQILSNGYYSIGYYLESAPGKEICEDALLIHTDKHNILLAVCDGVGGSDRSYRAAKNTLSALSECALNASPAELAHELLKVNTKLMELEGKPQTTLTCAFIKEDNYYCMQIGDSALIQCSNHGTLKYKSAMHSPVGREVANNLITESQALSRADLNIVDNVLGHAECYVDTSTQQEISRYDTLFLASDGIFDNFVTEDLIALIYQDSMEEACSNLSQIAKTKKYLPTQKNLNKIDDISFICLKKL